MHWLVLLEDLINAGVNGVVRIGGRSKIPIVQNYNQRAASDRFNFSKSQNRRYAAFHADVEEFEQGIVQLSQNVFKGNWRNMVEDSSRAFGRL